MAKMLILSKRAAHLFAKNIPSSQPDRNVVEAMRWRRIGRRIRDCCENYYQPRKDSEAQYELDMLEYPQHTAEWAEAIRRHNKFCHELDNSIGLEQAKDSVNEGILIEGEDFKFLYDKLKTLKQIPTEGILGELWEEIHDAFEEAFKSKDATLKAVNANKEIESA